MRPFSAARKSMGTTGGQVSVKLEKPLPVDAETRKIKKPQP